MTPNYPHLTREDAYFEVLEAFIRGCVDRIKPNDLMAEQVIRGTGTKNTRYWRTELTRSA
jgi:hypothetical protein